MEFTRREAIKLNLLASSAVLLGPAAGSAQPADGTEGEHWLWWDSALAFKLTGKDTGGSSTWILTDVQPKEGTPLHKHSHEDEVFYVLSGSFEFLVGASTVVAGPGSCIYGPREVPHRWTNVGAQPGRILMAFTPAGIEDFFLALAVPIKYPGEQPHIDMAVVGPRIPAAAGKAGLVLVGPKKYPRG
jgi:quercetin dioxygenase-like cupin family protein